VAEGIFLLTGNKGEKGTSYGLVLCGWGEAMTLGEGLVLCGSRASDDFKGGVELWS